MTRKTTQKKAAPEPLAGARKRKTLEEAAYYRWQNRGGEHGRHVDDWLDAEEELAQNVFERDPED